MQCPLNRINDGHLLPLVRSSLDLEVGVHVDGEAEGPIADHQRSVVGEVIDADLRREGLEEMVVNVHHARYRFERCLDDFPFAKGEVEVIVGLASGSDDRAPRFVGGKVAEGVKSCLRVEYGCAPEILT